MKIMNVEIVARTWESVKQHLDMVSRNTKNWKNKVLLENKSGVCQMKKTNEDLTFYAVIFSAVVVAAVVITGFWVGVVR
jgi:hypothetical protein